MQIHTIKSSSTEFNEAATKIFSCSEVGIDTETTGLDCFNDEVKLLQIAVSSEEAFVFFVDKVDSEAIDFLLSKLLPSRKTTKIFHNGKFDLKFLSQLTKSKTFNVFDTMLASKLIALAGRGSKTHTLAANLNFYCKIDVDKSLQTSDFSKEITDEQVRYAAKDAMYLIELKKKQEKYLKDLSLEKVAKVEFDALPGIARMEVKGFYIDPEAWMERIESDEKEKNEAAKQLHLKFLPYLEENLFGESSVDLDSPKQVLDVLKGKMNIPIESTNEHKIKHLIKKYPVVGDLFKYRGYSKSISAFGEKYLNYRKPDGRLHPDFWQLGAATGRMSCSNPNLQQVPKKSEYRECFKAETGNLLVVADYSQIEIMILAELSQDKNLCFALNSGIDLHSFTASKVLGKPLDECGKGTEARSLGKNLNFGTSYGVGARTFAIEAGISEHQAKKALDGFWSLYSGLKSFQDSQALKAQKELVVRTPLGRTCDISQSRGRVDNIGRNFPVQGTGADILKRAIYLVYSDPELDGSFLCNCVHDELVFEVKAPYAEQAANRITKKMLEATSEFISTVECKVDVQVSEVWKK